MLTVKSYNIWWRFISQFKYATDSLTKKSQTFLCSWIRNVCENNMIYRTPTSVRMFNQWLLTTWRGLPMDRRIEWDSVTKHYLDDWISNITRVALASSWNWYFSYQRTWDRTRPRSESSLEWVYPATGCETGDNTQITQGMMQVLKYHVHIFVESWRLHV